MKVQKKTQIINKQSFLGWNIALLYPHTLGLVFLFQQFPSHPHADYHSKGMGVQELLAEATGLPWIFLAK